MIFDIFFSLAQAPRPDGMPSHGQMLAEFLDQAQAADDLGFDCLWVAESHFSSEAQKHSPNAVIPNWQGEVGINTDFFQLATIVMANTKKIGVGSAILNILANGGPIMAAERVASALAWQPCWQDTPRALKIGFSSGRFEYIHQNSSLWPRNPTEQRHWPRVKNAIFREACEIFIRLLQGETLGSNDVLPKSIDLDDARLMVEKRWFFEQTRVVPSFDTARLDLTVGSHDPQIQVDANAWAPVKVFNLSITSPAVIEETHQRMTTHFNPAGGPWRRGYMPRTALVFVNGDTSLSESQRRAEATERGVRAIRQFWAAMDGTVSSEKIDSYARNALMGSPRDVATQMAERFHPDDRLMLWFDFFAESSQQVIDAMAVFHEQVVPALFAINGRTEAIEEVT